MKVCGVGGAPGRGRAGVERWQPVLERVCIRLGKGEMRKRRVVERMGGCIFLRVGGDGERRGELSLREGGGLWGPGRGGVGAGVMS